MDLTFTGAVDRFNPRPREGGDVEAALEAGLT